MLLELKKYYKLTSFVGIVDKSEIFPSARVTNEFLITLGIVQHLQTN